MWITTALARRVPFVDGRAEPVLSTVGSVALGVWALGEMWRGVNPFRRLLGLGVLVGLVISAVR